MTARDGRHMPPETLGTLLRAAVLAPSSHNTQPWTFSLEPGVVHLHADRTRALPVNDPDDRELAISCRAALSNLRVAAWHAGAISTSSFQVAQLRMDVAAALGRPCFPQVILQLGHPAATAEPARRRPIADVIETAES